MWLFEKSKTVHLFGAALRPHVQSALAPRHTHTVLWHDLWDTVLCWCVVSPQWPCWSVCKTLACMLRTMTSAHKDPIHANSRGSNEPHSQTHTRVHVCSPHRYRSFATLLLNLNRWAEVTSKASTCCLKPPVEQLLTVVRILAVGQCVSVWHFSLPFLVLCSDIFDLLTYIQLDAYVKLCIKKIQ